MQKIVIAIIATLACSAVAQVGPATAPNGNCDKPFIQNSDCSNPDAPLTFTCCSGMIFWSYPTGTCYIKLVSNCTAPSTTSLSVEAEYTANLVQNYMSGSVFEESETGTQGALRAYFGGGRKAPGGMRFQGTTGSVNTYLPSNTAFLKLASGTKLNLYGVQWNYAFSNLKTDDSN